MGIVPHYYFPCEGLKFYTKKEKNTIVMEYFKNILFQNSGPANISIPIYQYGISQNKELVVGCQE